MFVSTLNRRYSALIVEDNHSSSQTRSNTPTTEAVELITEPLRSQSKSTVFPAKASPVFRKQQIARLQHSNRPAKKFRIFSLINKVNDGANSKKHLIEAEKIIDHSTPIDLSKNFESYP